MRNLVDDEKQRTKYLEEKLAILAEEKDVANQLLDIEKKKNNSVEERQENLLKATKKLRKELKNAKMEKSELENAMRDGNKVHEEEREKLQKLVIDSVEEEAKKMKELTDERKSDIFQQVCYCREENSPRVIVAVSGELTFCLLISKVLTVKSVLRRCAVPKNKHSQKSSNSEKQWLQEKRKLL